VRGGPSCIFGGFLGGEKTSKSGTMGGPVVSQKGREGGETDKYLVGGEKKRKEVTKVGHNGEGSQKVRRRKNQRGRPSEEDL